MRSFLPLILAIILILPLCSCNGNYTETDLLEEFPLSADGIVKKELLDKIKAENAIATFVGCSEGLDYKWTIFGSELKETKDVNLLVTLKKLDSGINVLFSGTEAVGSNALLSIILDEKWTASGATAYRNGVAVSSVSITGSDTSVLNVSAGELFGSITIIPNETVDTDNKNDNRLESDGSSSEQDKYLTDPIPEGKPLPVEPENQETNKNKKYTCTFSIECSTILNNLSELDPDKLELIPPDGTVLAPTTVTFYDGESVFDVLQRVCRENNIHLEFSWTPIYNSAYIEGIHNLYEFDCGALSGWMYRVDGWYPNYGCSRYQLADGEAVEWRYTCELGEDIGRGGSW